MRKVHGHLAVAGGCQEWAEEMRFAALEVPKQSPACPSISFLAINHGPSAEQKARVGGGGRSYRRVVRPPSGYVLKVPCSVQLIR
jgi:hypothetical protein